MLVDLSLFICLSQVFHLPISGHDSGAGDAAAGPAGQDVSLPGSQWLGDERRSTAQLC